MVIKNLAILMSQASVYYNKQTMRSALFICLYSKLTHKIAHQRMLTHLDAYSNKTALKHLLRFNAK